VAKRKSGEDYEISDEFWAKLKPLLPLPKPKKKAGRSRKDDRRLLSGIFYLLRTGCQWKSLPRFYGVPRLFTIDFRNGKDQAYFKKCGKLVYWSTMLIMN
jgi:putative transposase